MTKAQKIAASKARMKRALTGQGDNYTARRAGRDNNPKWDASGKQDSLQGVVNAGTDVAASTEVAKGGGAGLGGKDFEAELAAMYTPAETMSERLKREAKSRNNIWSNK